MTNSGGQQDLGNINLRQIGRWILWIFSLLDKLCPAGQRHGKGLVVRGVCAGVGFGLPFAIYLGAHLWAKSSLADVIVFFGQFPTEGYLVILFFIFVIGLVVGHDDRQSYCKCLTGGCKWGVTVAVGVLVVGKGLVA